VARTKKPTAPGRRPSITVYRSDAEELCTLGPTWPGWTSERRVTESDVLGATFVRLRPPADVTEARLDAVRTALTAMGARHKLERPNRGATVPAAAEAKVEAKHRRGREVALGLVGEARTRDREALRSAVESVADRAGV
jgi:hypothetical protein